MKIDDLTLMAFHDGELDPERARSVRRALLADPGLAARREGLVQLGDFVRAWAAAQEVSTVRAARPERASTSRVELVEPKLPFARPRARGAFGAALALLAVTLAIPSALPRGGGSGELSSTATDGVGASVRATPAPREPAVAVESVDFGAQAGAIFLVQSAKSETTVVWLPDDPTPGTTGTL
jgi:anti-sigma factor RsiW